MRTALFWVVTQRVVIISYRRFGTTSGSNFREKATKTFHLPRSSLLKPPYEANGFIGGGFLAPEDGTDKLSLNVCKKLPLLAA